MSSARYVLSDGEAKDVKSAMTGVEPGLYLRENGRVLSQHMSEPLGREAFTH